MTWYQTHSDIYLHIGYPSDAGGGGYTWISEAPSQDIIDVVSAMPITDVALYDLTVTTDANCLALEALLDASTWSVFTTWHNLAFKLKCKDILEGETGPIDFRVNLYDIGGLQNAQIRDEATLRAAGFTRFPWT